MKWSSMCAAVFLASFGCGPSPISAQDDTESSTLEDGDSSADGDGDGDGDGDDPGDGDGDLACAGLLAEIDPLAAELQGIVDGAIAYFEVEHPPTEWDPGSTPLHRCPHPLASPSGGEASITPHLGLNCNAGPECKCVPETSGGPAGFYDLLDWLNNSVWQGLGFVKDTPHAFKYNFIAVNDTTGYGRCVFTAQAFGDFDNDGIMSTYERVGSIDEEGFVVGPLVVAHADE